MEGQFFNQNTTRCRHWAITWNNYPENAMELIQQAVQRGDVQYVIAGREVGRNGTPHLQMHVYFKDTKRLTCVRRVFPHTYAQPTRTTPEQCVNYCKKGGDYVEFGVNPLVAQAAAQEQRNEEQRCKWSDAKTNARARRFDAIDPAIYVRYYAALRKMGSEFAEAESGAELDSACGLWVWGPPDMGKTTTCMRAFPNSYLKNATKWWDGYAGQDTVIMDEMASNEAHSLKQLIKTWGDRFAFSAERKGDSCIIRPKLFVITANWSIEQIYRDPIDVAAMRKRFFQVHFDSFRKYSELEMRNIASQRMLPFDAAVEELRQHHDQQMDFIDAAARAGHLLPQMGPPRDPAGFIPLQRYNAMMRVPQPPTPPAGARNLLVTDVPNQTDNANVLDLDGHDTDDDSHCSWM